MEFTRLESCCYLLCCTAIFSILMGLVFSKMNLAKTYKGVNVKGDGFLLIKLDLVLNMH